MNIHSLFRYITNPSLFLSQVFTLMTGTILAQLVAIVTVPVLTRLYTPFDYGIFAVFLSTCMIFTVVATGRYELAIILPQGKKDALSIVILGIVLVFVISSCILLFFVLFNGTVGNLINNKDVQSWLVLVPAVVLFSSFYQILYYWFNRTQQYRLMAQSRMFLAIVTATVSIVLGMHNIGVSGLIAGSITGNISVVFVLSYIFWRQEKQEINTISRQQIVQIAKRYINFPKYLVISHAINTFSSQLPIILLNVLFGNIIVGHVSLAQRIIGTPFTFIGQSIGDVFRQKASDEYKTYGKCPNIYRKTLKLLSVLGIVPCVLLLFGAPYILALILGDSWSETGKYIQILSIAIYFRLISSPLSMMYIVAEKQRYDLILQIYIMLSSLSAIYLGWYFYRTPELSMVLFSVNYAIIYVFNIFITKRWACVD